MDGTSNGMLNIDAVIEFLLESNMTVLYDPVVNWHFPSERMNSISLELIGVNIGYISVYVLLILNLFVRLNMDTLLFSTTLIDTV